MVDLKAITDDELDTLITSNIEGMTMHKLSDDIENIIKAQSRGEGTIFDTAHFLELVRRVVIRRAVREHPGEAGEQDAAAVEFYTMHYVPAIMTALTVEQNRQQQLGIEDGEIIPAGRGHHHNNNDQNKKEGN